MKLMLRLSLGITSICFLVALTDQVFAQPSDSTKASGGTCDHDARVFRCVKYLKNYDGGKKKMVNWCVMGKSRTPAQE